ncbi:MAG: plasmid pRiA4b ORF-3 family protein [Sodaliphilus sp.]
MKLRLSPDELYESFMLLDDEGKFEFLSKVSDNLLDPINSPIISDLISPTEEDLPYNPDWQFSGVPEIELDPEWEPQKYTLRVELKDLKPPIWRKIVVPSNLKLESLAHVILKAMGWEMSHLHQFIHDGEFYILPEDGNEDALDFNSLDSRDYYIADLLSKIGKKCLFVYDFGDSWSHVITLQKVEEYAEGESRTRVSLIGGKRACPIEDVGGTWGYQGYVEALNNPNTEEAKELIDWYGHHDPEAFDLKAMAAIIDGIPGNE